MGDALKVEAGGRGIVAGRSEATMVLVADFTLGCIAVISESSGLLPSCRLTVN